MKRIDLQRFPWPVILNVSELFERWLDHKGFELTRRALDVLMDPKGENEHHLVESFSEDIGSLDF